MFTDGVGGLAVDRLRRRPGQWLSVGAAIVAAVALVTILAGLSVGATDRAIQHTLERLDPAERAIQVSIFAPTAERSATYDEGARTAIARLGAMADAPVPGVIFNRAHDQRNLDAPDVQLLAADDLGRWSTLTAGRWPAPCNGTPCEVVLASHGAQADALPARVTIAGVELQVVGRAELTSSLPFERPDLDAERAYGNDPTDVEPDPPPAYLLVEGSRDAAANGGLADVGRTYRWTAPLRADAIHAWTVAPVTSAIERLQRELAGTTHDYAVRSPSGAIGNEVARGQTAAGRLELVGALALAVLVAFAVFAGVVVRSDVGLEIRRLRGSGATTARVGTFLALEVLLPTLGAGIVGLLIGTVVVAWLADAGGTPVGPLLVAAIGQPGTIALSVATALVAAGGVLAGILVTPRRGFILGLLPGVLAVGVVLGWQLLAGEGLGIQLLRGALGGPVLVLLPALLAFAVAGAFLIAVPVALRALARRSARLRLPLRLAFLSLAREPARPAATLTLLALSVGALVFAAAYGATVRTGIADGAAFETGADLRVAESGTGLILSGTVVPVDRYAALGPGVEAWPVLHRTTRVEPAGVVTLLGIDPASVDRLAGWRADFSQLSAAEIGRRVAVPGDFSLPGHRLASGATRLGFDLTLEGDPVKLHAIVAAPDGDFSDLFLGTYLAGHSRIDIALPGALAGGSVVGLRASDSLIVAGPSHPGSLGSSTLRFRGLNGLIADDQPADATVVATVTKLIRAPFATDDLTLPAVVSPDVAAVAAADGTLSIPLGAAVVRIRVVGVASRFPTVDNPNGSFVVAAYDPLLMAINGAFPGAGHPDEMWIRTANDATTDRVLADLSRTPFRAATVTDRAALVADRTADPFAASLAGALLAAALTGLALAAAGLALGVVADLRDEAGDLADLETMGAPPSTLRSLIQARTVVLAAGGIAAGLLAGAVLTVVITSSLALAAGATVAVPELRIVLPWATLAIIAIAPLLAAIGLVMILSRRGRWAAQAPVGRLR
jgi:hypothetical protein